MILLYHVHEYNSIFVDKIASTIIKNYLHPFRAQTIEVSRHTGKRNGQ